MQPDHKTARSGNGQSQFKRGVKKRPYLIGAFLILIGFQFYAHGTNKRSISTLQTDTTNSKKA